MTEKEETEKDTTEPDSKVGSEVNDVIYTIKPVLIFENLFGIFRFRVIDNVLVKASGFTKFIGILITLAYILIFSAFIQIPTSLDGPGSLKIVGELPLLIVLIQYVTSVIIAAFFIWKPTARILSSIADLDAQLCISMNKDFYKQSRKQTIKFLALLFSCHVVSAVIDQLTDTRFRPVETISFLLYIEQDIEIFVFCKMVYMLKSRLSVINDYLSKFVLEQENNCSIFTVNKKDVSEKNFNFIGRSSPQNMKIRDLAAMYDVLGETCLLVNEVFNFQMFMNLVSTFTYTVVTIWTSLYYFRKPEDSSGQMFNVVIWCILTVFSVAVMALTCETLLSTRRTTKILVNEIIMDYDLPKTMRVQAKVFMELIDAWPLRIFVYDMFSVDITLMLKFISVATTYLIVVIQLSHFI